MKEDLIAAVTENTRKRKARGLPDNLEIKLVDPLRILIIKSGKGKKMRCRQKKGPPLRLGEYVYTEPGADGKRMLLKVYRATRRDVYFAIIGLEREGAGVEGDGGSAEEAING